MPEPLVFTEDAIRARWQVIGTLPINGNLDLARFGEQSLMDVPALLELLAENRRSSARRRGFRWLRELINPNAADVWDEGFCSAWQLAEKLAGPLPYPDEPGEGYDANPYRREVQP